jgi:hypothetical protein
VERCVLVLVNAAFDLLTTTSLRSDDIDVIA